MNGPRFVGGRIESPGKVHGKDDSSAYPYSAEYKGTAMRNEHDEPVITVVHEEASEFCPTCKMAGTIVLEDGTRTVCPTCLGVGGV